MRRVERLEYFRTIRQERKQTVSMQPAKAGKEELGVPDTAEEKRICSLQEK